MIEVKNGAKTPNIKKFKKEDFPIAIQGTDGTWIFSLNEGTVLGIRFEDGDSVIFNSITEFNGDVEERDSDVEVDLEVMVKSK